MKWRELCCCWWWIGSCCCCCFMLKSEMNLLSLIETYLSWLNLVCLWLRI